MNQLPKAGDILRKDATGFEVGQRHAVDFKFREATNEDLKRELQIEDLSSLPDGYVAGWASTQDLDWYNHVVVAGAFDESINAKGLSGPKGIKLLAFHDADRPAGVIKKLETRNGDLWIEAELNLNISYVRDMYEAAKMNGGLSFSVGFMLMSGGFEFVKDDDGQGEHLEITKAELLEVSVVTFPGNEEATMTFIKGVTDDSIFGNVAQFEKALVASGLCKSRNDAHRVAQVVKRNAKLFMPQQEAQEPVVATKQMTALEDSMAEFRKAFEN